MKINVISIVGDVIIATFKPNRLERFFGKTEHKKTLTRNIDKVLHWDTTLNKEYFYVDENINEYYLYDEIILYNRKVKHFEAIRKDEIEFNKRIEQAKNKCVCDLIRGGKVDCGYCGECNMHWG